jgi:hypothetical protein
MTNDLSKQLGESTPISVLGPRMIVRSCEYTQTSARDICVVGFINGNRDSPIISTDYVQVRDRKGRFKAAGFARYLEGDKLAFSRESLEGDDVDDAPAEYNTCLAAFTNAKVVSLQKGDMIQVRKPREYYFGAGYVRSSLASAKNHLPEAA